MRRSTDSLDLHAAARDLWPGGTLEFWQGRHAPWPEEVIWPSTSGEVASVLSEASRTHTPVVPYGAGSGVCGGARGKAGALVVDLKGMARLGDVDREEWSVEVDAGVNGQHLEDHLAAQGFTCGHSPSSIWCSTVGGWAAARGAGQFSSKYGVFEDMVLALEGVAPGTGPFRVGMGGDAPQEWMEALLGSEGTLAVITRVKMRVWPVPQTRWLRGYRFGTMASALRAMAGLMAGELWPSVVRLYDPIDTRIGGKTRPKGEEARQRRFLRDWLRRAGRMPAVKRRSLVLPLALPGLVNRIAEKLSAGCLLIVGWEGEPAVVDALSRAGHALLTREGEDLGAGPGERWFHSRHAVSYKLMPVFERGGFADTMEVATTWSKVEETYEAVRAALRGRAVVMAHMSHAYPEGAAIYFSFAGLGDRTVYQDAWTEAQLAVLDCGGTVTHHHGVGFLKADHASAEVGPAIEAWRATKATMDPEGVMNPGRLYREVPYRDPGPAPAPHPEDGMARVRVRDSVEERQRGLPDGFELMWPWERLPAPPRWQRNVWQTGWVDVHGSVGSLRCRLGRGPRSAAGPDARSWLAQRDPQATATVAIVKSTGAWMGEAALDRPWAVARTLLRSDLRPAVLSVVGGKLRVGFRGPAAADLGVLASKLVPGGLVPVEWTPVSLPSGQLRSCDLDDPGVVAVLPSGALKRGTHG